MIMITIMQICYAPLSKIESEAWVRLATRLVNERKIGNSEF